MDISYKGANCIELSTKQATVVIDAALSLQGPKDITVDDAVYIATQARFLPRTASGVIIDGPGEYEVKDLSVTGAPATAYQHVGDEKSATIYRIATTEVTAVVIGHIAEKLTEEQLETMSVVDIVIIPIGGNGYTLDAKGAMAIIKQLDPKVIIPTHYADTGITYEVPQDDIEAFIKEVGVAHEVVPKLKIKAGVLPATLTVMEIKRS